jgi:hypothetical protein
VVGGFEPVLNVQRRYDMHEREISNAGRKKLDFAERGKCKPVLPRIFIGYKSGKTTFVPLWDRMEGAWLWTQGPQPKRRFYYRLLIKTGFGLQ